MASTVAAPVGEKKAPLRRGSPEQAGQAFNRLAATCVTLFALIWLVPFLWR